MKKIAIIGAGLSGLTVAHLLKEKYEVKIFEKEARPGGLIKCERVEGSLYHICGGHVFNSKRLDVLDWFWGHFQREEEFTKADRNAVVFMEQGKKIPYPIENHAYRLEEDLLKSFVKDLVCMAQREEKELENFEDFLKARFGETLFKAYFEPYNRKIWRCDLRKIPLSWLEGKLPMPTLEEIIYNNINKVEEKNFVHSTFWYEKKDGSQYIVDKLSKGLNITCEAEITAISKTNKEWNIQGETFDKVVFCGIIKDLPTILKGVDISSFQEEIDKLDYHGTTSVFCEIDKNSYSWIYLPSSEYDSHRIICTGNFAKSNNASEKMTATIEFTDNISKEDILANLKVMPLTPKYLTHHYNQYTYPIQDASTRKMIVKLKKELTKSNFYMTGRFCDWEYYNMDAAIGAAMDLCRKMQ